MSYVKVGLHLNTPPPRQSATSITRTPPKHCRLSCWLGWLSWAGRSVLARPVAGLAGLASLAGLAGLAGWTCWGSWAGRAGWVGWASWEGRPGQAYYPLAWADDQFVFLRNLWLGYAICIVFYATLASKILRNPVRKNWPSGKQVLWLI